jgi:hypothetical protein
LGIKIWGENLPVSGQWHTYMGRITDKSSWYPVSCLMDLVRHINWENVEQLHVWQDCGTHFRSRQMLTCLGKTVLETVEKLRVVWAHYGCEHHFKSIVDGHFGRLSRERLDAAQTTCLTDPEDLVKLHGDRHEQRKAADPSIATERYILFWPPEKKEIMTRVFRLDKIPVPLRSCYSWSFTRKDFRRKTLMGAGAMRDTLKNVDARAVVLSTNSKPVPVFELVLEKPAEAGVEEAADEEGEEPVEEEAVNHQTKLWRGWKMSYRMQEPDKVEPSKHVKQMERKQKVLDTILTPLIPLADRTRTVDMIKHDKLQQIGKQAVKTKAFHHYYASKRRKEG